MKVEFISCVLRSNYEGCPVLKSTQSSCSKLQKIILRKSKSKSLYIIKPLLISFILSFRCRMMYNILRLLLIKDEIGTKGVIYNERTRNNMETLDSFVKNKSSDSYVKSFRTDKRHIDMLYRAAQIRQVSEGRIINSALDKAFASDATFTEIEREYAQQQDILSVLRNVESILEYSCIGDINKRIENLISLVHSKKILYPDNNHIRKLEVTVFEIMEKVKNYDIDLYRSLMDKIKLLKLSDNMINVEIDCKL